MNVIFLGDVVGSAGCAAVRRFLPQLKREYSADLTIVNGENAADGNGILPQSAQSLLDSGADVITTGNHVLRRAEIYDWLDRADSLILRPANMHPTTPGRGSCTLDLLRCRVTVVNLMGNAYMDRCANLFDTADALLEETDSPVILMDLHGEATAEKMAMAHYLDGKISLLAGTHTHVQTADERIFPLGTGYITDLGMCGPVNSVLGIKPELAVKKMRGNLPVRFENAPGPACVSGIAAAIDEKTGKTSKIQRIFML